MADITTANYFNAQRLIILYFRLNRVSHAYILLNWRYSNCVTGTPGGKKTAVSPTRSLKTPHAVVTRDLTWVFYVTLESVNMVWQQEGRNLNPMFRIQSQRIRM
jgi:hypothetical protein